MTTDIVNSFLNRAPYHLPFDVQLSNHMRKCRFLDSFCWVEYCQDMIFWFALMIQQTSEYGITETWFKHMPGFGFKLILLDGQNNAYVRNVFREYKNAPRGLAESELKDNISDISSRRWSLKEYLITSKKIIELKSSDAMINKCSIGAGDPYCCEFFYVDFSLSFRNETNRQQYTLEEPFKNFFRHHNFGTTERFLSKMDYLLEYYQQFWLQHRSYNSEYDHETYDYVEFRCASLHGSFLAFHSISRLMPEVIQLENCSRNSMIIRLKENAINLDCLPTVISVSCCWTDEERKEVMKQFSTRSGLHGQSAFVWPFESYGITHTCGIMVETAYKPDATEDVLQLNWILDELNSIWPVDVQAPVNQFDEICDSFYLSRYITGLLCSNGYSSQVDIKHKTEFFVDHQSNQFLLSTTGDGNSSRQIILQIDEYPEPVDKVEQSNGQDDGGISIVKINQYMNRDRILRRQVLRFPVNLSSSYEQQGHTNGFVEISKFFDLFALQRCVHDCDVQLKVSDAMSKCFRSVDALLNGRNEVQAFVNGAFHYFDAVSLDNDSISKTLAVKREQEQGTTELVTFNFLTEYEVPVLPSHSAKYDQKIVNIVYRKPYPVHIIDVAVFLENEVEILRI